MRKLLIVCLTLFVSVSSFAQVQKAVKWNYHIEQKSKNEALLVMTASIDEGWHIYSQFTPDGGPLPTMFSFDSSACYSIDGKVTEPKAHEEFDSTFDMKVLTLEGNPSFTVKIKLSDDSCVIRGRVDGQVCKDMCILFGDTFTINIDKPKAGDPISK